MNCREAQAQLFAEQDGAPGEAGRTALAAHLAQCASCRRIHDSVTAGLAGWRAEAASVTVPDAEKEWYAVRRRIRGAADGTERPRSRRNLLGWLAMPLTAAAALAVALFVTPPASNPDLASPEVAHAARVESVNVPGSKVSTMVYVDDKSGWLFVWASDVRKG